MKKRKFQIQIIACDNERRTAVANFESYAPWLATDVKNIDAMNEFFPEVIYEIIISENINHDLARFNSIGWLPTCRVGIRRKK